LSIPFDAATGKISGEGKPLTAPDVRAIHPDFSADGKKLAYIAEQTGKQEIRERVLADGQERVLYAVNGMVLNYPRWSPDGKFLVYRRVRSSQEQLNAILSVEGGEERLLTSPTPNGEATWEWSADGKWILAGSRRQTNGRFAICLFPLSAAPHAETEMRVIASSPNENLYQGRFSPNQRWVSFIAANAINAGISNINIVSAQGGEWIRISEGKYFDDKPRWSPDGRTLYFISNRTGFFNVWGLHIDPATAHPQGEPFRVTRFENPSQMIMTNVRNMDMALTAKQLMLPITEMSGGIWILENID
jgi:Tol biopolymer transport system component